MAKRHWRFDPPDDSDPDMTIGSFVRQCREALGLNQTELAKRVGTDQGTISKIEKGERAPSKNVALKMSELFGVDVAKLLASNPPGNGSSTSLGTAHRSDERPETLGEDIPVLGHGRGGIDGFFFDNGNIIDRVERPASLRKVPGAYAVYMHGTSQEPRIRHGELCYVHPHQPPSPGDDVVVQLHSDEGFIKTYVKRTAKLLVCSQYNPAKEIQWPADQVKAVHRIVWIARTVR